MVLLGMSIQSRLVIRMPMNILYKSHRLLLLLLREVPVQKLQAATDVDGTATLLIVVMRLRMPMDIPCTSHRLLLLLLLREALVLLLRDSLVQKLKAIADVDGTVTLLILVMRLRMPMAIF